MEVIADKNGETYRIERFDRQTGADFKAFLNSTKVQKVAIGYANCCFESNRTLLLADLKIREDVILVYRRTGLFAEFKTPKRQKRNFQHLGIGTELLKCVIHFAKAKGLEKVVGKIVDGDYSKNPRLPRWYEQRGFVVTMESATRGQISMTL